MWLFGVEKQYITRPDRNSNSNVQPWKGEISNYLVRNVMLVLHMYDSATQCEVFIPMHIEIEVNPRSKISINSGGIKTIFLINGECLRFNTVYCLTYETNLICINKHFIQVSNGSDMLHNAFLVDYTCLDNIIMHASNIWSCSTGLGANS